MSDHVPRIRVTVLGILVVCLLAVLTVRLYDLQVVSTLEYQAQAEANRVRLVQIPAPRGRILDRNGDIVVDNEVVGVVAVKRVEFEELDDDKQLRLLQRLTRELNGAGLNVTGPELARRINDNNYSQYAPVPIAQGIPESLRLYLAEHSQEFPSVTVERTVVRTYPYGALASNILGYIGRINEDELSEREDEERKPYALNDQIGKTGVERSYERALRGTPGWRRVEVDAEGNPVRTIEEIPAQRGSDLFLSIDIDLQALAEYRLLKGLEESRSRGAADVGSVVVEDPRNGEVLAMASYPQYDVRKLADGVDAAEWAWLNDPANGYPLNNWAIRGEYAPGSTFKLFVGYAALQSGVMAPDTIFTDSGGYQIPGCSGAKCYRTNAGGAVYGSIAIPEAITVSSDAYFYNVGAQFWLQREQLGGEAAMQSHLRPWGIGELTGIPLEEENDGRLASPQWRRDYCEEVGCAWDGWTIGDNVNIGIGQGDMLMTPLQLANGYATMANGGTRYRPQVVDRIEHPNGSVREIEPESMGQVDLPPNVRDPLLEGLVGVTRTGTASSAFAGFPVDTWPVAGKTGTAQVEGSQDTSVFAAFGPAYEPRYAVSAIMEESGFGSQAAAPVVRTIMDAVSGTVPLPEAPLGGDLAQVGAALDEQIEQQTASAEAGTLD